MIANIPQAFVNAGYFQGFDRPLWYAAVVLMFISSIVFFIRMKKAQVAGARQWYFGFALFSVCYGLTRLCFNLGVDFGNVCDTCYDFWTGLGYTVSMPGVIALMYAAEKNIITGTKHVFTCVLVGGLVIGILGLLGVYSRDTTLILNDIVSVVATVLIFFIYIVLIRNSTGTLRKKTIGAFSGIIIWFVAIILDGQAAYSLIAMPTLLPPIMYITGVILYTIFQRMD